MTWLGPPRPGEKPISVDGDSMIENDPDNPDIDGQTAVQPGTDSGIEGGDTVLIGGDPGSGSIDGGDRASIGGSSEIGCGSGVIT